MKDRLKNLFISDSFSFEEEINTEKLYFNRLYDKLNQFGELTSILIKRKTNEPIQFLEDITATCKSLKEIELYRTPTNNEANATSVNNNNISFDYISKCIPANNIKSLKVDARSNGLLSYIMHKFPQLHTLSVIKKDSDVHDVSEQTLIKLVNYLSGLKNFSVSNVRAQKDTIWDTIENHWNATSKFGSKRVEFTCKKVNSTELQTLVSLSKQNQSKITSAKITYYASSFNWELIDGFVKKVGIFVREFQLNFQTPFINITLMESFMENILTNCPNIKYLHIDRCVLQRSTPYSSTDLSKRRSIHELCLENCILDAGLLERWSLYVPETKRLRLGKITYRNNEVQSPLHSSNKLNLEIIMPCTKIGLIVFEKDNFYERISLKIFAITEGIYYYYQYDRSEHGNVSDSIEQEYQNATNSKRIFICCQTKPDLLFKT